MAPTNLGLAIPTPRAHLSSLVRLPVRNDAAFDLELIYNVSPRVEVKVEDGLALDDLLLANLRRGGGGGVVYLGSVSNMVTASEEESISSEEDSQTE